MNFSPKSVEFFKNNNIDSILWASIGNANENYIIIFDYADKIII